MAEADLPRKLGLLDTTSILVGVTIGAGIFLVPNLVARNLPSAGSIVAVWLSAGILSFFGALAYAELGAMIPSTGGQYVFLRESYGPMLGFLCGWTFFLAIQSAATAWLAVGFSIYFSYFVPLTPVVSAVLSVSLISVLTFVNYRGIQAGALVQNVFTFLKIAGLAILIGSAFLTPPHAALDWSVVRAGLTWSQFGVAMIACLLAYDGWVNVSFVVGEVRDPRRNVLRSLVLGVSICIAIYLLANLAYLRVLPVPEIAATERAGAAVAERTLGSRGGGGVSMMILISIIGSANGHILTAPRIYFAQARDGLFFKKFGEMHPRFETPSFAILIQGVWTAILAVTGSYQSLLSYAMFSTWIFYGLTVLGVPILRRKYPDRPRPYRMWGYPVTPLLFAGVSFWLVINTLITTPRPAFMGLLIIAAGIPAYYFWRNRGPVVSAWPVPKAR